MVALLIITSGQSNLTEGRIAIADGRFNRIRHVAPMCPPVRAHWRHLANTSKLVLPSAHPSPQPKRQIDRFSHFCTPHGWKSLYFTMGATFPKNYPWGIWTPCNTWYFGPIRVLNPKGISIGSAFFCRARYCDRPTDHATRSVAIGRIYARSTAMRANNNKWWK